ncbi:plexin-A4-like [Diadema antillarum]|uniref:plexin-A4-like n=1 Tax=Diadema antillarum TaxID=105358 RepID=UPI003A8AC053
MSATGTSRPSSPPGVATDIVLPPQGYIASGDGYSRRFDEVVADIPRKTKCVDDTLIWSDSIEEAFFQAANWLDTCGRNGITLNPSKFVFAQQTVEFAGFEITPTAVRPCPQFLRAIRDFPTPTSITDIRSWFGLINQVSYAFASAERMLPFRALLKPDTPFVWTTQLNSLFEESKRLIIAEIHNGVEIFDKGRSTCLATDWSKDGIGFWLLQKHCSCSSTRPVCCKTGWKTTLVGSRFTSHAESRYAPIEGEALAVIDALDKARHFVIGCSDLIVAVDHKPLLKTFGDRSLNDIPNPRLRNLKEKSLRYRFRMVHVPALQDPAATHAPPPLPPGFLLDLHTPAEATSQTCTASASAPTEIVKSVTWDAVRLAMTSDPSMSLLLEAIEQGFPENRNDLPPDPRQFHQFRDSLSHFDGVALYRDRVVIPPSLRGRVLQALHAAHQGITQMCSRAESSIFWPGMTPAITEMRTWCSSCNRMAPSQPAAPPTPPASPAYPFQCIAADYFHFQGHNYLVIVDRYSNWPIVEEAATGADGLIIALRRIFVTYGISDELSSDGGPELVQFNLPSPESVECNAVTPDGTYYTYANGVNPVNASPVLTFSDVEPTSIITTTERDYTVAFIGTSDGDLLKVHILNDSSAYQYENVSLGQGSVLRDVFLDEDKEQIILATGSEEGSQVLKLSLANCSNYQTCDECIGGNGGDDGDPYCGWCTLEARCTRYMDCARSDESTRWLSYNAVQCVSISDIQPSDSIRHDLSEQQLTITVQQLPALTNSFEYMCVFDSYEVSAATSGNTVNCTTPPSSSVPPIPEGADNVAVPLSIKSTESGVNFVERDFFFFDCTRISSCSSCVTSRWPCDWCVYENRCTHDSSSCVDDIIVYNGDNMPGQTGRRGQGYCPQLLGVPEETLIPVNIAAGYSIMASNLPTDPTKVTVYECVMHVDGSEQTVAVTYFNETFVNCPARQFYPAIGPVDGGTRLEVFGTDLGVNFEDISNITVAGIECDLNDMEEFYEPGQSVSCLTGGAGQIVEGQIDLTVTLDNQTREANSEEEFLYRDPMISGFTPTEGPAAGGTRVTISGDFLTSGRNVIARFGDEECIDIARSPNETSCTTAKSSVGSYALTMTFDGTQLTTADEFTFQPNPVITGLDRTQSIMSGGLDIIVTGERFDLIQMPVIKAISQTSGAETSEICNGNGSATVLTCPSPTYPGDTASRRRRQTEDGLTASLQFDFDGFVIDWNEIITYFPDPVYYNFEGPDSIFNLPESNLLELNGSNLDLASKEGDVQVFVGGDGICAIQILESEKLICKMPEKAPSAGFNNGSLGEGPTRNLPAVHVSQGNLGFSVGYVQYPTGLPLGAIIGGACGGAVLIIIVMVLVGFGLYRRSYENLDKQAQELELVEKKIQQKVEAAFHDLQADMSEVEEQVKGLGIPFVNTQDYTRNMLFSGLDVLPATSDPESIKIQCEKGPVDIVTAGSHTSPLNFDCLLEEDVEFQEVQRGNTSIMSRSWHVDSITQAKQKILDAAYRRRHVVNQKRAHEMDLSIVVPSRRRAETFEGPRRFQQPRLTAASLSRSTTIETMGVTDNNRVALIEKVASIENRSGNYQPVSVDTLMFHIYDGQGQNDARIRDYTKIQTREGGYRLWHLVPEEQMNTDAPQSRTKLDKEFSAPHLLVTKKTIEHFLNNFLSTILNKPEETPVTIKYLFDFFDEMAGQHCGGNEKIGECAEAWKSNSLPLHYWVTTLTHPSYVFDMRQSRCADQSVSVLANMLDNAFKKVIPEKKEDSSLNRVLFVKDLPGYIKTISEYYRNIASRFTPTDREMHVEYDRIGQEFAGLFSRVGTLKQLYEFTCNDTAELVSGCT